MTMLAPTGSATATRLLLNERDAAKALSLSIRTLFNLRSSGQIEFVRQGSRVLYPVASLQSWIDKRRIRITSK